MMPEVPQLLVTGGVVPEVPSATGGAMPFDMKPDIEINGVGIALLTSLWTSLVMLLIQCRYCSTHINIGALLSTCLLVEAHQQNNPRNDEFSL